MELLRHPNVVSFYGVCINPEREKGLLVLECCEGRDLHSALQLTAAGSTDRLFSWYRRGRRIAYETAKAINYLHSKVGGRRRPGAARRPPWVDCTLAWAAGGCSGKQAARHSRCRCRCRSALLRASDRRLAMQGVTHMDVKSGNVLLTASGEARLSDVGLSRHKDLMSSASADARCIGTFAW